MKTYFLICFSLVSSSLFSAGGYKITVTKPFFDRIASREGVYCKTESVFITKESMLGALAEIKASGAMKLESSREDKVKGYCSDLYSKKTPGKQKEINDGLMTKCSHDISKRFATQVLHTYLQQYVTPSEIIYSAPSFSSNKLFGGVKQTGTITLKDKTGGSGTYCVMEVKCSLDLTGDAVKDEVNSYFATYKNAQYPKAPPYFARFWDVSFRASGKYTEYEKNYYCNKKTDRVVFAN
jgi:hypothetical protein